MVTFDKDKLKALEQAVQQIDRQFGKGAARPARRQARRTRSRRSRPARSRVDVALGVGGVPRGRVIEIYGPESSGKTTLTLHIIAEAQKRGGIAAFIDAEHALDAELRQEARAWTSTTCWSPSPTPASRRSRSPRRSSAPAPSTSSSSTRSPRSCPKAELEGEMGDASWACRPA